MISWFVALRNDNFALTPHHFQSLTLKFVNKECFAHDINYYTYDLNTYGANPVTMAAKGATDPHTNVACRSAQWADACYVRCVHY